jgi:hypothetical protein
MVLPEMGGKVSQGAITSDEYSMAQSWALQTRVVLKGEVGNASPLHKSPIRFANTSEAAPQTGEM